MRTYLLVWLGLTAIPVAVWLASSAFVALFSGSLEMLKNPNMAFFYRWTIFASLASLMITLYLDNRHV